MTKISKLLGLAVVALVVSTGALLGGTSAVRAEPVSPARFVGTVKIDGANAPAGTTVEARVGNAACGVTTVFTSGSEARYVLDVEASQPDGFPDCGTDGAQVRFLIAGKQALETGTWHNYQLNTLNLTFVTPTPTPTATNTPVPPTNTPGAGGTGTATATNTAAATPKPPSTGQGTDVSGGSNGFAVVVVLIGLGALAFGVGGAAAARRSR